MNFLKKVGKYILWWIIAGGLGATLIAASAFLYLSPKLPPADSYRNIRLENPLRIYSADNKLIAEIGTQKRDPIKYAEIPPLLVSALIASEDSRFYNHHGVDLKALARSVIGIISGNQNGGGSTITMQVAKNISFEGEDPYSRKFKEILLALQIERELSKEDIVELYLNRIFFGISAYGISAAATQYYNKALDELSLAEIAMTIAILPSPNSYNPLRSPERALTVRSRVLRRMREFNMITENQFFEANNAPLTARRYGRQPDIQAPYIAEMVRQEMLELYGESALTDGFEVYTTIDSHMQEVATLELQNGLESYDRKHGYRGRENLMLPEEDESINNWLSILAQTPTVASQQPAFVQAVEDRSITALLKNGESIVLDWEGIRWAKPFLNTNAWGRTPRTALEVVQIGDLIRVSKNLEENWILGQVPEVNGGLISIAPGNGAIRALVGGYDFNNSKFNRITQAERQPGSNFKPFLYAAALENGYTAASLINDAPLPRSDYRPENYSGQFLGPIRLKYALTTSKNLVSLRLYDALGSDIVLPYISRFGFNGSEFPQNDLTVAIGSHAVTPLQVASAYTVFANGGHKVEPFLIDRIVNFNDGEVFRAQPNTVCKDCESPETIEAQLSNNEVPETVSTNPAPRVIDESVAFIMNTILRSVITSGSGRPASREIDREDIKGKTGTTNDSNDLWFSGFNGELVTTVYVGFDQPATLGNSEQAATVALPIWIEFMKEVLAGSNETTMAQPDGLATVRINEATGLRARPNETGTIFEVFREENIPEYPITPVIQGNQSNSNTIEENPRLDSIF